MHIQVANYAYEQCTDHNHIPCWTTICGWQMRFGSFFLINVILRARGRAERQWGIKLGNARPCCVIKACKCKWQKMHLDNAQLTSIYPAGLECVYGKCGLNNFVFLKKYNKVQPHLTQHTITTQPPSIPHHTPT